MQSEDTTEQSHPVSVATFSQDGIEFHVQGFAGDHIFSTVQRTGDFYERVFLDAISEFLSPDALVIDAGANIGNHTLYFARMCGARVVAYEALAAASNVLRQNVDRNGVGNRVTVRPKALGSTSGHVEPSTVNWTNIGATAFHLADDGVEVVRLDDEDFDGPVALLKVDVEGMDVEVLRGARTLIERDRPVITCEAGETQVEQLDAFVASVGYAYLSRYNPTPTYVALPNRSPREQARCQRALIAMTSMSHMATRDLYYRVRLLNERLDS